MKHLQSFAFWRVVHFRPMKNMLVATVVFMAAVSAGAQTAAKPLDFKGNYLGMSVAEFKSKNGGFVFLGNIGKPNLFGRPSKKNNRELPTPLCTDEVRDFPGDSRDLKDDEILCNAAPGRVNPDARTVLGTIVLDEVVYRFYRGKLYGIEIHFSDDTFEVMSSAFKRKYGPENRSATVARQNGYGATWSSSRLFWKVGGQLIILMEGPGNGPAQDRSNIGSGAVIVDPSLQPPNSPSQDLDF